MKKILNSVNEVIGHEIIRICKVETDLVAYSPWVHDQLILKKRYRLQFAISKLSELSYQMIESMYLIPFKILRQAYNLNSTQ